MRRLYRVLIGVFCAAFSILGAAMLGQAISASSDSAEPGKSQSAFEDILSEATAQLKVQFAASLVVENGIVTAVPETFFETTLLETIGNYCGDELCFPRKSERRQFKAFTESLGDKTRIKKAVKKFRRTIKPGKTNFYSALKQFDNFADDMQKQLAQLLPAWFEDFKRPQIMQRHMPIGIQGELYRARLEAIGSEPPYTWTVDSGSNNLPGLEIEEFDDYIEISGTPTNDCFFPITVTVSDRHGRKSEREIDLHVMTQEQAAGEVDLVISDLSISPASAKPGNKLTITYSLQNIGKRTAEPFEFGIFLSKDAKVQAGGDYPIYIEQVGMLRGENAVPAAKTSLKVTLPNNLWQTGKFYIGAIADIGGANKKYEKNKNQNVSSGIFNVESLKQKPVAILEASPSAGAPPLKVHFDARKSYDPDGGKIVLYNFNFGDRSNSGWVDNPSIDHTYDTEGTYHPNVTVRDDESVEAISAEFDIVITSFGAFVFNINYFNTMVGINDPNYPNTNWIPARFQFDVSNCSHTIYPLTNFKLDWGDGTQSSWKDFTYPSTQYIFNNAGTFNVRVKLRNSNGQESGWSSAYPITTVTYTGTCDVVLYGEHLNNGNTFNKGDLINTGCYRTNTGPDPSPPFYEEMWLSNNFTLEENIDIKISTDSINWAYGVSVGRVASEGQHGTIPASVPSGEYTIILRAIVVGDSNTSNNVVFIRNKITIN